MKRKLFWGIAIGVVIVTGYCAHGYLFRDDEARIREIIEEMRMAAEQKRAQAIMEHFSGDYTDSSGNSKFVLYQIIRRTLTMVEEVKINVSNVSVLVTGDQAVATMEITSQATRDGNLIHPIGSDQDPERPRVTFQRTSSGDWEISRVENVDSRGL